MALSTHQGRGIKKLIIFIIVKCENFKSRSIVVLFLLQWWNARYSCNPSRWFSHGLYFFKNISKVHNEFIVGKIHDTAFCFLGLDFKENENCISLNLKNYACKIHYSKQLEK